jgi:hypothetical protein
VHSEFYFTDVLWPAFRKVDFLRAIRAYQARNRRPLTKAARVELKSRTKRNGSDTTPSVNSSRGLFGIPRRGLEKKQKSEQIKWISQTLHRAERSGHIDSHGW